VPMEDCLFCKIVAGDIQSQKVYEDENIYAFLDIKPVHLGHTLVVSKKHSEDILSIDSQSWGQMNEVVHKLAPKVKEATQSDGINIIMNNKKSAGQLIDHAHIHIIPRFLNDGFKGLPQHEETKEALDEMAEKIARL